MRFFGKHTDDVVNRIVDAFREPDNLPQALAPIFIHKDTDVPCRRWSWHNQLLVALHGTIDARGYNQWRKVKRHVRKGAKAIWILAPCIAQVEEDNEKGETILRDICYGFRSVPVFAIEDTEGEDLPESDSTYDDWVQQLPLLEVARAWDIDISTYSHVPGAPLGYFRHSSDGEQCIGLGTTNISTFTHELVHAADHRVSGLGTARWHKEIVAELGSATLLTCLGQDYDADLGGAYQYIRGYADKAQIPVVKACMDVIGHVCESVNLILQTAQEYDHHPAVV